MKQTRILCRADGGIALITMDAPEKMNTVEPTLVHDLHTALRWAKRDESVRAVILTGMGNVFSAGGDLGYIASLDHETSRAFMRECHEMVQAFSDLPKPVIAAVNGAAVGAGLSLTLLCDVAVCADSARFGTAFIDVGVIPDMGLSYHLPRVVGLQRAKELCLTGRLFDAQEAFRLGIVSRVVPSQELPAAARSLAQTLASKPEGALAATKQLLNASQDMSWPQLLQWEAQVQSELFVSDTCREKIRAFSAGRKRRS